MNLDKLDAAIAHIEAHREQHDQAYYFWRDDCGTTTCLAGTAALQAGWRPVWIEDHDYPSTSVVERDGVVRDAFDVARDVFGLTEEQAVGLFVFTGDLAGVKRYRDRIAAEIGAGPGSTSPGAEPAKGWAPPWLTCDCESYNCSGECCGTGNCSCTPASKDG